ncbi:MAG: adaptor protein MecA, partial [Defluviitaleaceae bacterium]|nr:adaptor protein MecA [Defluviitaleaceae bacterium]
MKIQKISENQIKFVLTQDDLNLRNMQLHELSYGSAKAQELFSEIMQRAGVECGFYTSKDTPLIIEAIPVHENGIVVMITKITNYADLENTGMAAVLKNFGQQLFPDFMPPCGASPFDIFEHLANLPHHMPHMPHMHQQQLSPDHD